MTANLQLSGKASNGLIFVVGGDNYNDFVQNLLAVNDGDMDLTMATLTASRGLVNVSHPGVSDAQAQTNVTQAFPQAQPVQHPGTQPPAQQYQQPAPFQPASAPTPPPGQSAPICSHGQPRVWKEGQSANGRAWKAWMCQLPKGQSCEPQWVR